MYPSACSSTTILRCRVIRLSASGRIIPPFRSPAHPEWSLAVGGGVTVRPVRTSRMTWSEEWLGLPGMVQHLVPDRRVMSWRVPSAGFVMARWSVLPTSLPSPPDPARPDAPSTPGSWAGWQPCGEEPTGPHLKKLPAPYPPTTTDRRGALSTRPRSQRHHEAAGVHGHAGRQLRCRERGSVDLVRVPFERRPHGQVRGVFPRTRRRSGSYTCGPCTSGDRDGRNRSSPANSA